MRHRVSKHCACTLLTAGVIFGLTGCGVLFPQKESPVVLPDAFLERLDAVCDPNTLIQLSSITTVEWDEAFVFPEGTPPELFEATTGNPPIDWGIFGKHTPEDYLMVLQQDGEIVEVMQFRPGRIRGNLAHPSLAYDADVLVRMTQADLGCYGELVPLQFAEEGTAG